MIQTETKKKWAGNLVVEHLSVVLGEEKFPQDLVKDNEG